MKLNKVPVVVSNTSPRSPAVGAGRVPTWTYCGWANPVKLSQWRVTAQSRMLRLMLVFRVVIVIIS
jgi:hypothetical protein